MAKRLRTVSSVEYQVRDGAQGGSGGAIRHTLLAGWDSQVRRAVLTGWPTDSGSGGSFALVTSEWWECPAVAGWIVNTELIPVLHMVDCGGGPPSTGAVVEGPHPQEVWWRAPSTGAVVKGPPLHRSCGGGPSPQVLW